MNRKITDFCSESYPIFLILKKAFKTKKYDQLVFERTQDIFSKIEFGEKINEKIALDALRKDTSIRYIDELPSS